MPQHPIWGASAVPCPSCIPQAEMGLMGLRTGQVVTLQALSLWPAGCPGTAGPGESPLGLTLMGWLTR